MYVYIYIYIYIYIYLDLFSQQQWRRWSVIGMVHWFAGWGGAYQGKTPRPKDLGLPTLALDALSQPQQMLHRLHVASANHWFQADLGYSRLPWASLNAICGNPCGFSRKILHSGVACLLGCWESKSCLSANSMSKLPLGRVALQLITWDLL